MEFVECLGVSQEDTMEGLLQGETLDRSLESHDWAERVGGMCRGNGCRQETTRLYAISYTKTGWSSLTHSRVLYQALVRSLRENKVQFVVQDTCPFRERASGQNGRLTPLPVDITTECPRKTPRQRSRAEEKQGSGLFPRYLLPHSSHTMSTCGEVDSGVNALIKELATRRVEQRSEKHSNESQYLAEGTEVACLRRWFSFVLQQTPSFCTCHHLCRQGVGLASTRQLRSQGPVSVHAHHTEGVTESEGREGTNGIGGGIGVGGENGNENGVGGGNEDVNGDGDRNGAGAGTGTGTGVEANGGAKDGNGDGDGD